MSNNSARLREQLAALGASGPALDELAAYTANPFDRTRVPPAGLPLDDGPQVEVWEEYVREAARDGVLPALARRLVQLRFPIEAGISQTAAYRAATRRGIAPDDSQPPLALDDPDGLDLVLYLTLAGRVPVITCRARADFVTLVRACSCRNEPEAVPGSMGACIVNGLNNWDRIARLRSAMESRRGAPFDDAGWAEALREIVPQKGLYQDRIIILSREPYSAVPAAEIGMSDPDWCEQSVAIRREHEATHYFTLVAFGVMRNNLFDELIADFAGLVRTRGRYDAGLALRFLGLEAYPAYRPGGRFENYLDTPPVGAEAAALLRTIVVRAARTLETFAAERDLTVSSACDRLIVALAASTLVDLAGAGACDHLAACLDSVPASLDRSTPSA